MVGYGSFKGVGGLGVVGDGTEDGAGLHAFDVFPADGVGGYFFAWKADTGKTLGTSEGDATVLVVPGIGLILAHDRELDPVDGFELGNG